MGSSELILLSSIVLGGGAIFLFVYALIGQVDDKSLSFAIGQEPVKSKSALMNWSKPLVHQFTLQHAVKIKNANYRKRITKLLLTAGLSREMTTEEFIGLQLFWGVALPALFFVMNFAFEAHVSGFVFAILVPLGWKFPDFYAKKQKSIRETSVRADLPFFADLLALSTEAGLDFIQAIQRIVEKSEGSVFGEELSIVLKDIKLGSSRSEALKGLVQRLDISEITSFVAVLVDADSTGASISQVLKDQSTQIRLERFVRAEKAGARASQLILFPIIFFIVPAVFMVVFGPVVVNMMTGGFK